MLLLAFDRDMESESGGRVASKEGLACDAYLPAPTLSSQLSQFSSRKQRISYLRASRCVGIKKWQKLGMYTGSFSSRLRRIDQSKAGAWVDLDAHLSDASDAL